MSQAPKEHINAQKKPTYNTTSATTHNTSKGYKIQSNTNGRKQNPEEARNNAAIAAANRMNAQSKSPENVNTTKVTKQKKKMINALADIEKREKELEQLKADRIKKGQSVE